MNFPTLETCRAIGAEFPESEYVWCSYASNMMHAVIRKRNEEPGSFQIPAPICEELGEWLRSYLKRKHYSGSMEIDDDYSSEAVRIRNELFDSWMNGEDETQARAEAVELILKERQQ